MIAPRCPRKKWVVEGRVATGRVVGSWVPCLRFWTKRGAQRLADYAEQRPPTDLDWIFEYRVTRITNG